MSEQWHLPLAIIGLVVALLFMAGLVRRYQQSLAERQAAARRLAAGAHRIEDGLQRLGGVPLPADLGSLLRRDVLERYRRIVGLDKRFPQLNRLLLESGARLKAEPKGGGPMPLLCDERQVARVVDALDDLTAVVEQGELLQSLSAVERRDRGIALRERRAEALAAYFMRQARETWEDNPHRGRAQLNTLQGLLRERGPSTELVKSLYEKSETLGRELAAEAQQASAGAASGQ